MLALVEGKGKTDSIVVLIEVVCDHGFMPREGLLEVCECITRAPECSRLNVVGEFVKPVHKQP